MKEIIYLDTNYLNSYIAQENDGLITGKTLEIEEREGHGKTTSQTKTSDHKPKINMGVTSYQYGKSKESTEIITFSDLDVAKEIVSKKVHDNALIDFENHMKEEGKLKEIKGNDIKAGSLIKINDPFRIVDIKFLKNAFGDPFLKVLDTSNKIEMQGKINSVDENTSISQNHKKNIKKSLEMKNSKEQQEIKNNSKGMNSILEYLTTVLPTESYVKINNFVVPLKESFLRETTEELSFKYGSEIEDIKINVVGKIARKFDFLISPQVLKDKSREFKELTDPMNAAIQNVLDLTNLLSPSDFIISPIAIYFEEDDEI